MEQPSIILRIVCPDRPGLVSQLTSWIYDYGGNIKHSDHHTDQDAGLFLSRIEWNSKNATVNRDCLLYTSPSPRDKRQSRMPSSA